MVWLWPLDRNLHDPRDLDILEDDSAAAAVAAAAAAAAAAFAAL
jgi:hypothetical protein